MKKRDRCGEKHCTKEHENFENFERKFREETRVKLNWDKVYKKTETICVETWNFTETERKTVQNWICPWYLNNKGEPVAYWESTERGSTLEEILVNLNRNTELWEEIETLQKHLVESQTHLVEVPAIHIDAERKLVLDGNHRLSAILHWNLENIQVKTYTLRGTYTPRILPDLRNL